MSFATYDASTGVYQAQTRDQFFDSLTADIQRALDAAAPPKSLREIQAEDAATAAATQKKAAADVKRSERVAAEKAAAEAAWESDRAARDASGKKPCFVCEQFAQETHFHAPKRDICPLSYLFYVFDRWDQPNTAYLRRDAWLSFKENKERISVEAGRAAAEASRASELGGLIDAALTAPAATKATAEKQKAAKKGKKQTVERFQLDDI